MSGKIVNLRTARKQAARAEARREAAANAARHGEDKAARRLTEVRAEKAKRDLDGHRRDS
jgi:hypothetical protein